MKGVIVMAKSDGMDEKINGMDKWEVKCAMETLAKAHEIKKDKKLMEAIGMLAKEKMTTMASIVAHVEHEKGDSK